MSYSVLRKFLSTTALFAVASTISACSGEVERFGSPVFGGFTSNQKETFTASTRRVAAQPAYNQPMPAAVPVQPQAGYNVPVYQAPNRNAVRYQQPVYAAPAVNVPAPVTTGSISRQPVYNRAPATPVPVYNAPAPAPVYTAPVYNAPAQRVPVYQPPVQAMRPNADYLATGSIGKVKLDPKPMIISSFHALPKAGPRRRSGVDYTATAATRPTVLPPMPAKPVGNRPNPSTYGQPNYSRTTNGQGGNGFYTVISRFFSLPKAAPRSKSGVDYGATAAIDRRVYTPSTGQPTALPPVAQRNNQVASVAPISLNRNQVQPRMSGRWSSVGGTMVQVRAGEDLNALSRRYGVPAKAIAEVNGLPDRSFIAPGQQVLIPVYQQVPNYGDGSKGAQRVASLSNQVSVPSVIRMPKANPLRLQRKTPYGQQIVQMQQNANASQRHMVLPGDTLSGISRRYNVSIADLAAANKMSATSPVRMGQRLHIPARQAAGVDYTATASIGGNPYQINSGVSRLTRLPVAKPRRAVRNSLPVVRVSNSGPIRALPKRKLRVAAVQPRDIPRGQTPKVMNDAQPAPVATRLAPNNGAVVNGGDKANAAPKFRWPVRGRIISNFGRKRDGGRNDGINLAVPAGASVRVAEGGKVIYSGSKLKGYGNLVLVQHDNGWVTAYAHNEKLLVSKGQVVRRGQIIAQAGKTGNVDSPQVHFELRIKGDPVDPVPYLVTS